MILAASGAKDLTEIVDQFENISEVSVALENAGLKKVRVIIGIDYTASNERQGKVSFGGRNLHHIDPEIRNPYQQVIATLGEALASFADDGCIPVFGFGDKASEDKSVFPLVPQNGTCNGFEEVLAAYNKITPTIALWGPTSFSPIIKKAMRL